MLRVTTLDKLSIVELEELCEVKTVNACELFRQAAHTFDYKRRNELQIAANRELRDSSRINALILQRIRTSPRTHGQSREARLSGSVTGSRERRLYTAFDMD